MNKRDNIKAYRGIKTAIYSYTYIDIISLLLIYLPFINKQFDIYTFINLYIYLIHKNKKKLVCKFHKVFSSRKGIKWNLVDIKKFF